MPKCVCAGFSHAQRHGRQDSRGRAWAGSGAVGGPLIPVLACFTCQLPFQTYNGLLALTSNSLFYLASYMEFVSNRKMSLMYDRTLNTGGDGWPAEIRPLIGCLERGYDPSFAEVITNCVQVASPVRARMSESVASILIESLIPSNPPLICKWQEFPTTMRGSQAPERGCLPHTQTAPSSAGVKKSPALPDLFLSKVQTVVIRSYAKLAKQVTKSYLELHRVTHFLETRNKSE